MSIINSRAERAYPPSKWLLWAEWRAVTEVAMCLASLPTLATAAPRGDGHTVLVLPGFLASDQSTELLRFVLRNLGYNALGWDLGQNLGGLHRMRGRLRDLVAGACGEAGRKVSIVGWSLGGVYARDLALQMPEKIRAVITLGTPFTGDLRANNVGRLYDIVSGEPAETVSSSEFAALRGDLPLPTTSVFSRTDGVVSWRTCLVEKSPCAENIEVLGASHLGLAANSAVLWAIADRLAQPEGRFTAFTRGGPFALAYGR